MPIYLSFEFYRKGPVIVKTANFFKDQEPYGSGYVCTYTWPSV